MKQIPLGDAISIRFKRLITAPGGVKIRSIVPGSGPHGRGGGGGGTGGNHGAS
ncbi:hypothetical protein [Desulfitobacterium sp.]|uniref:hypothetical protein n=1 Tax=Desulfitobacterium sp. TaxID=49981 RepID=UPI002B1F8C76|nr:hypothetical protein [Desulfitobacterium sp.]MEA4902141.1 hypothetical protein [Desulfitobacterium sp.]